MTERNEIVISESSIVLPAVSPEEAVDSWKQYQDLKNKIATREDVQTISGKEFFKKSYWRKLATFFNLSVEVVEEKQQETEDSNIIFHFTCKAIAPNGRYAVGTGSCDLKEKQVRNTIHNTRCTAETRAWNRAVSNLVGGGEVSAEEMNDTKPTPKNVTPSTGHKLKCTECQIDLSQKVFEYSVDKFQSPLCMQHQKDKE